MSQIQALGAANGGGGANTFVTDAGNAVPAAGIINILGSHGINTAGAGNTVTIAINNAITLGDLAVIAAGSNALSATTGDINIAAGNLKMPITNAGSTAGTIKIGAGATRYWTVADDGNDNFFVGQNAGNPAAIVPGVGTANANQAFGGGSMFYLTTGMDNSACGHNALRGNSVSNLTGSFNTAVGAESLQALASGSYNCAIGWQAGNNYTAAESSNIIIGYTNLGTAAESNTLRIGSATGAGNGQLNKAFISGINGVTASNARMVTINSVTNQLGEQAIPTLLSWTVITGATQAIVVNNGYIANRASTIAFLLPATAAIGDIIRITGIQTATSWQITQNANQQIFLGTGFTTVGVGGSVTTTAVRDSIELVCVVAGASTVWNAISWVGNLTIV